MINVEKCYNLGNASGGANMKKFSLFLMASALLGMIALPLKAQENKKVGFANETYGTQSTSFSPDIGNWHIDNDGAKLVYAADGRRRGPEFPISIFKGLENFKGGSIETSFKAISGNEDQAAGIAFNIKSPHDYLVVRANALENNLILFKVEKGRRSSLRSVNNVPTATGQWHTLKVIVSGNKITGYVDNKKYLDYEYKGNIDGKIGLWSKADSYVFFDKFAVTAK
jgi:hypothetical protein